jgi:mRNA-degrading endonuclease HigB of HigAB toxin-antitoxin module
MDHPGCRRAYPGYACLVAAFDFRRQIAFVKFIGTHVEYDRIDVLKVSQF